MRDGAFVAALPRPDRSARTWWRTPIDEAAWKDAALELYLPHKAELSDLDPALLKPGALPELWTGDSLTVAAAAGYFANARAIAVRGGEYDREVGVPACPRAAVEAAIGKAVEGGLLRLVAGPASFQGEPLPGGVSMDAAELRAPMAPIDFDRLMPEALPGAWRDGKTTALALSNALSAQDDGPVPMAGFEPRHRRSDSKPLAGACRRRRVALRPDRRRRRGTETARDNAPASAPARLRRSPMAITRRKRNSRRAIFRTWPKRSPPYSEPRRGWIWKSRWSSR